MNNDMPRWRGSAPASVLTSTARQLPVVRVGDPRLRAVEHVDAIGTRGGGAHRLQVGAAVGFGQRQPAAQLGRPPSRGRKSGTLLVGAVAANELRHHQVRVDHAGERHPRAGDGLDDPHVGRRRQPEPAVLRRDGGARTARTRASARPCSRGTRSACSSSITCGHDVVRPTSAPSVSSSESTALHRVVATVIPPGASVDARRVGAE